MRISNQLLSTAGTGLYWSQLSSSLMPYSWQTSQRTFLQTRPRCQPEKVHCTLLVVLILSPTHFPFFFFFPSLVKFRSNHFPAFCLFLGRRNGRFFVSRYILRPSAITISPPQRHRQFAQEIVRLVSFTSTSAFLCFRSVSGSSTSSQWSEICNLSVFI